MRAPLFAILALLAGVALGAAGAIAYLHANRPRELPAPTTTAERLERLRGYGNVAAIGRLQPKGDIIDIGGLMGDRLGRLEVAEGQLVKKGHILGYLDSHAERKAEYEAFKAQLAEAKERLDAETAYADTQVREAQVAVRAANELDAEDVRAQEAKVQGLQSELANAQSDLARMQGVTVAGAIPAQKLDQQSQLVRRLTQELAGARATLTKAQVGQSINLDRAKALVAAAQAGRRRAAAAVPLESLAKSVTLAEARLDRTLLRAPRDARVLAILCRPGERVDQKPILQLGDTSALYAVAEVYETDIPLVRAGQRATITSPAIAGELGGVVERIGWSIHKNELLQIDPTASADSRIVKVWIKLDDSTPVERLTNHQVDIKIDVSKSTEQ
jgi:HlyD family secretion protein